MLNASDCLSLSKEVDTLAIQLRVISKRLEAYVIAMEYNQQVLDGDAVEQKDGSFLLLNDDETEELIKNYRSNV